MIFSKALLAKQIWWLLQNLNSLSAMIIKAKYYLNSSILQANMGKHPSFAWRTILSDNYVITQGSCGESEMGNIFGYGVTCNTPIKTPVFKD
jgi:hypothetical protein